MIGRIIRGVLLLCLVHVILAAGSSRIYAKDPSRNRRDASCPSCSRDRPDALANWSAPPRESRQAAFSPWSSSIGQSFDPLQSSPLQSSPLQSSPFQSSPFQSSPLQSSPLQSPFLQLQPQQPSTLQSPVLQLQPRQPPTLQSPFLQLQSQQPASVQLAQRLNAFSTNSRNPYVGAVRGRGGPGVTGSWGTIRRENPFSFGTRDLNPDLASAPASPFHSLNPPVSPVTPFQPISQNIGAPGGIPYRRPTTYDLTSPQFTPTQTGSVYENPKLRPSVVYRADNYDDGSSEEDNVPLYPSDYPRRLQNTAQDNIYSTDYPTRWLPGQVNGVPQSNAALFPLGNLRRVDGARQGVSAGNLAGVQLSRAEAIVKPPRDYRVINGAGNILSQLRDSRMTDRAAEPQVGLQDAVASAVLKQPQTDRVQDARMTDRLMHPQIDQTQDTRMRQRLAQSSIARDTRMADQFTQHPEDDSRMSSIMQVPEAVARAQELPSDMAILKMMQQIGSMFANRSSLEDQQKHQAHDQHDVQLDNKTNENDQVPKSMDSSGTGEVKEKRDVADGEKVPVMANDQLEWSSLEDVLPGTTPKIVDMAKLESMA